VSAGSAVAAFDFDGTLTRRDSLLPFLRLVAGARPVAAALAAQAATLVRAGLGRAAARDAVKAGLVETLLAGRDAGTVRTVGDAYGRRLARHALRPEVAARLRAHRDAGHAVVVVSASLDVYLEAACRELDVDALLCTRVEVGADGRLTGRLAGANCRGAEKARRLAEHLGSGTVVGWAYGDSGGDRELLGAARRPVRVARWPLPARLPALATDAG
jgi:phosphatidylglycerophosphatase C